MIDYVIEQYDDFSWAVLAINQNGICFLNFAANNEAALAKLQQQFPTDTLQQNIELRKDLIDILITGTTQRALDPSGTSFQKLVWQALQQIPKGQTRCYQNIAQAIQQPRALRAVGSAIGANPIIILIPCHRVIRKDGSLGGFSAGLHLKKILLKQEGTDII